jgi:hypothetical protein
MRQPPGYAGQACQRRHRCSGGAPWVRVPFLASSSPAAGKGRPCCAQPAHRDCSRPFRTPRTPCSSRPLLSVSPTRDDLASRQVTSPFPWTPCSSRSDGGWYSRLQVGRFWRVALPDAVPFGGGGEPAAELGEAAVAEVSERLLVPTQLRRKREQEEQRETGEYGDDREFVEHGGEPTARRSWWQWGRWAAVMRPDRLEAPLVGRQLFGWRKLADRPASRASVATVDVGDGESGAGLRLARREVRGEFDVALHLGPHDDDQCLASSAADADVHALHCPTVALPRTADRQDHFVDRECDHAGPDDGTRERHDESCTRLPRPLDRGSVVGRGDGAAGSRVTREWRFRGKGADS